MRHWFRLLALVVLLLAVSAPAQAQRRCPFNMQAQMMLSYQMASQWRMQQTTMMQQQAMMSRQMMNIPRGPSVAMGMRLGPARMNFTPPQMSFNVNRYPVTATRMIPTIPTYRMGPAMGFGPARSPVGVAQSRVGITRSTITAVQMRLTPPRVDFSPPPLRINITSRMGPATQRASVAQQTATVARGITVPRLEHSPMVQVRWRVNMTCGGCHGCTHNRPMQNPIPNRIPNLNPIPLPRPNIPLAIVRQPPQIPRFIPQRVVRPVGLPRVVPAPILRNIPMQQPPILPPVGIVRANPIPRAIPLDRFQIPQKPLREGPQKKPNPLARIDKAPPLPPLEGLTTKSHDPLLKLSVIREENLPHRTVAVPVEPLLPEQLSRTPEMPALVGNSPYNRSLLLSLADDVESEFAVKPDKMSPLVVVSQAPPLPPLPLTVR